ncbi:HEAT repeat domain-containing protein [Paenibacillus anseongense]|nr:HEAT repeat domain-containing protein [Paenibacillus anseongense]
MARALSMSPELLVADEITSALDPSTEHELQQLLLSLKQSEGMTILYITHRLETIAGFADRVAVMKDGVIQETGTGNNLQTPPYKGFELIYIIRLTIILWRDLMGDYKRYIPLLATKEGWQAAYAILDHAGKLALDDILEGLENQNWKIRKWCTALLDHNADQRSIDPLVARLTDSYADVRRHAVHSIGCQSCKDESLCMDIIALLIERAMKDTSIAVRRSAVHMLGNQPYDIRASEALEYILNKEKDRKLLFNAMWSLKQQKTRLLGQTL